MIEQAAVIASLKSDSYNDPNFGREIAKYLQVRFNTIEPNLWKAIYQNSSLNVVHIHRGVEKKYFINSDFLLTPEAKALNE